MIGARTIFQLLIEDDAPASPLDDPNLLNFNPDTIDPKQEILRYTEKPFPFPGSGPTTLYQRLSALIRNRSTKKVRNNTYIVRHPDRLAVRLHSTDVVTAYPDGKIVFNTGRWYTSTTRDRMNTWSDSGWQLFQKDFSWYWYNYVTREGTYRSDYYLPYTDGDFIYPDGSLQIQTNIVPIERRRRRR